MKKTKIVSTLGPASDSVETLTKLVEAGMNVARMNFSHGSHEEHLHRLRNVHEVEEKTGQRIGIMLDTKGPEIRTHDMKDHQPVLLEKGNQVRVSMTEVEGTAEKFSITYPELINDVKQGSHILVDDGLVDLKVVDVDKEAGEIITEVQNTGVIKDKKGVNVPGVKTKLPGLTEKDIEDIKFGLEQGIDFIAQSFVRKPEDVLEARDILEETGNLDVLIIPKIETQEAIDNLDSIIEVSDGLMIARGDLGVEVPAELVPIYQKEMIHKMNAAGKPVITATQMLDSMQRNPRPTRAESSDVANAIYDGSDAVMLSGETAAGDYPVEAVTMMAKIAMATEAQLASEGDDVDKIETYTKGTVSDAIALSVAYTARNLHIRTIVAATATGQTARLISKYRPNADILGLTFSENVAHKMLLSRGVTPIVIEPQDSTDALVQTALNVAKKEGYARTGENVLITAGVPVGEGGSTNLMQIQFVSERISRGQGVGNRLVVGRALVAQSAEEALERMERDSILILKDTDESYNEAIKRAQAIVVERGGFTSHAAVLAINEKTPVIVGAKDATKLIRDGGKITVDTRRGEIYKGAMSI